MSILSDKSNFLAELKRRREAFAKQVSQPALIIIDAAPEQYQCQDNAYRYRQDSDFYYLTGFPEAKSCLVMMIHPDYDFPKESPVINYRLFVQERNYDEEIWTGPRIGVEGAVNDYGADSAYSIETAEDELKKLILDYHDRRIYFASQDPNSNASKLIEKMEGIILEKDRNLLDALVTLHEVRVVKTPYEIELMRQVCHLSADAHNLLIRESNMNECVLDGIFTGYVMSRECPRTAYPNIVASGSNATILHYGKNNRQMLGEDLVLIDAGGEYHGYAADITRTWPINGKFTEAQREIYELVLRAQKQCLALVRPGASFDELQDCAMQVLGQGLFELGIITDATDQTAIRQYYMHGIGHWLGMDVHDCSTFDRKQILFVPGMVLTVEPGLYFSPNLQVGDDVARYVGIGVRIEDDVVVTEDGCEILSSGALKEVADLEEYIGSADC